MKSIVKVETSNRIYEVFLKEEEEIYNLFDDVFEIVRFEAGPAKYCMLVGDRSAIDGSPINFIGSKLYSLNQAYIYGDVYLLKECRNGFGIKELRLLEEEEVEEVKRILKNVMTMK